LVKRKKIVVKKEIVQKIRFSNLERLYTVQEVAEYLKVCKKTVYNWIELGRLRAVQCEKAIRIPESAIVEFLEKNQTCVDIFPFKRPVKWQERLSSGRD